MALARFIPAILLIMLLLISSGRDEYSIGAKVVEARTCESKSSKFKGSCLIATNCANVCRTEGFQGGRCRGFRRRCFCTRNC